jgi:hypothetical protein
VAERQRTAAGEIVDGLEVARADAVRDRADVRIGGDAAVEERPLRRLADRGPRRPARRWTLDGVALAALNPG